MPTKIETVKPAKVVLQTRKLGKQAPRLDRRTLKLSKYLEPAPPIRAGYISKVGTWPMFLNDSLGDCVIAAMGHMTEQWDAYSGNKFSVTDNTVLKAYEKIGGYVDGDPSTDNGCNMLTALKYWRSVGFGGTKITGFVSVDPTNESEIQHAIYLFGNVFAGFGLPLSAQNPVTTEPSGTPCWQVPPEGNNGDGSVGSWGGHCVPLVGYSADPAGHPGTMAVSWGTLYDVTWRFVQTYADEMYAVLSPDWFATNGEAPEGLNVAQLKADLAGL